MTLKELLIHELDNIPDPLIAEVLDFLHFLKAKQAQDNQPPVNTRTNLNSLPQTELSLQPNYPLQGTQPYRYEDPFAPAVPVEDWEVMQ